MTTPPPTDHRIIEVTAEIAVPADAVLAAAHDFSERRPNIFPAVSMKHLTVHSTTETTADVTEGTRGGPFVFWERCTYDWSQPGAVSAVVTDANVYAVPGSRWDITAEPTDHGSRVTMTWTREFRRRPLGRLMGFVYRHRGRKIFTKYAHEILENLTSVVAAEA